MKNTKYPNNVEFLVYGDYGPVSDPILRVGGEKCTYQIPTYEALKGILHSVYWKPTILWVIDKVRVLNPIQTEVKGIRTLKYNGGGDLSYYTYLKNCAYQVQAHFEWNENHPELAGDRNENKHHEIAKKMIRKGGRRDVFLGTRECQGYVEPCVFGEGTGAYDAIPELSFGLMYHGITYADQAHGEDFKNKMTVNFWYPVMKYGVIEFPEPEDCPAHKIIREMSVKTFENDIDFIGLKEFGEVN